VLLSWTSDDVRAAERPLLDAGVPLMERASFALAVHVGRVLRERRGRVGGSRVVVLVGPGDNGGDALHAGAVLAGRGAAVTALLLADRVHTGGSAALRRAGGRAVRVAEVGVDAAVAQAAAADVVLDGVLGIGGRGGPRGVAGQLVARLAAALASGAAPAPATAAADAPPTAASGRVPGAGPVVVAVDVPSGIGVDDGTRAGPVLDADLTVTFGAVKPGLLLPPAAHAAGRVLPVDIGLALAGSPAAARLEAADVTALWPVPAVDAHKYTRGVVGVVAGSAAYPGAAVLATGAAVLTGAGMVRYQGEAAAAVLAAWPEVVIGEGRVQSWVLGPGIGPDDAAQRERAAGALAAAQGDGLPVVVDAGALDLVPAHVGPHVLLTPHAGELARLLTDRGEPVDRATVEAEPLRWARRAHELVGATVLLKGSTTVVVGAHAAVYAQADAPAWLATAGAGDVLAGVLGTVLAGRADDVTEDPSLVAALAAAAASVHGRAARRANPDGPVHAAAVARAVPAVVADLVGAARGTVAAGPAGAAVRHWGS